MKVRIAMVAAVAAFLVLPLFTPEASATGQDWMCEGRAVSGPGAGATCTAGASSSVSISSTLVGTPESFVACTGAEYACFSMIDAAYAEPAAAGRYHVTVVMADFHAAASQDVPIVGSGSYVLLYLTGGCVDGPTASLLGGPGCAKLVVHSGSLLGEPFDAAPTSVDADEYVVEGDVTVSASQPSVGIRLTSETDPGGTYPMNGLPVGTSSSSVSARIVSVTLTPI